jgi:hypothetical protein
MVVYKNKRKKLYNILMRGQVNKRPITSRLVPAGAAGEAGRVEIDAYTL